MLVGARRSEHVWRKHASDPSQSDNEQGSEGFEEFDKICPLLRREIQPKERVVVIDDREQICRAAVMKVRRMLPDAASVAAEPAVRTKAQLISAILTEPGM